MLIQQPPTPYIGIIEAYPRRQQDRPSFTRVTFRRHGGSFLMPLLLDGIVTAALMPQEQPWVFCDLDWVRANEISSTGESTVEDSEESAESTDSCDSDQEWFGEDKTRSTGKRTVKDELLEDMHQLQSAVSQYLRKQEWFRANEISCTGESTVEGLEESAESTYSCDSDQEWIWEDETRPTGERTGERTVNQVVRELVIAISKYLHDCEILVITDHCHQIDGKTMGSLDWWLRSLRNFRISETRRRERIRCFEYFESPFIRGRPPFAP